MDDVSAFPYLAEIVNFMYLGGRGMCNADLYLDFDSLEKKLHEKIDQEFKIKVDGIKLGITLALEAVSEHFNEVLAQKSKPKKEFSIGDYITIGDDWNPPASP